MTRYIARKRFSIFEAAFHPGDLVPLEELKKVPNWEKLERNGFVTEERSDDENRYSGAHR